MKTSTLIEGIRVGSLGEKQGGGGAAWDGRGKKGALQFTGKSMQSEKVD